MAPRPFSDATATALEFPSLLRLIACRAASDLGRERIHGVTPFAEEAALRRHHRQFEDANRLVAAQPLVPYCEQPFLPLLEALAEGGGTLDGRDLVAVSRLLTIASEAARRIDDADPPTVALAEPAAALPSCAELERALRKTFDARGEIREDATPRLAELRRRLRRTRGQIYQQLDSLVGEHRDHLSEETIPMRGDRLVLVLQAGARGRLPGLIHGRSGTGKSFYFEPLEVVESNNQLQQSVEEEAAERRRILAEMVRRTRAELPAIEARARFVAELDLLQSAARFATDCEGRLATLGPARELTLIQARHPLLDPALAELRREALGAAGHAEPVVALDLELRPERRALVVTGPNAGGKTVALKTVGLLSLAHLCGLPIPAAAGSSLPFLRRVVATVGDEQDLLRDRSTFSGRLLRLHEAWDAAAPDSLILLDELGSGTDPEEGTALSRALLEGLVERRSLVLITTHLSQVAAAALELEGAFCAAMEFDRTTGNPTYRLLPGPPGGSEALALARRLDLPAVWLDRAEELLGSEHRQLRELLAAVERSRQELAETHARLDGELADAERLRRRLAAHEAELARERKTLGKTLRRQLDAFQEETTKRLRAEVDALREEWRQGRRKGLVAKAAGRLFEAPPELGTGDDDEGGEIAVGGAVKHRRLGWQGTLDKLERGRASVTVGGKTLHCDAGDLAPAGEPAGPTRSKPPRGAGADLDSAAEPPVELKLIGQRVEPALEALDRFLDQALLASHPAVRIIHGHGSGRLRTAVREHLRRHPAVASQRPGRGGEGGDGATIVKLR